MQDQVTVPSLVDLGQALASSPEAVVVVDRGGRIVAATEAAAVLAGVDRVEHLVGARSNTFTSEEARARLLADLIDELMDGYVAHDHVRMPDGRTLPGFTSVRRIALAEGPHVLMTVTARHRSVPTEPPTQEGRGTMAVLVTDHRWCIVDSTVDANGTLDLDLPPGGGAALLGMIHPVDSADAIVALARLNAGQHTVTTRLRIRCRAEWRRVSMTASRLCGHTPARLACVLTPLPGTSGDRGPAAASAHGHGSGGRPGMDRPDAGHLSVGPDDGTGPADPAPPAPSESDGDVWDDLGRSITLAGLNARQREIIMRLTRGESAGEIAAGMYLNPGTVRNQLSAIYRKFGVHSRSGLLGLFLRDRGALTGPVDRVVERPGVDQAPVAQADHRWEAHLPPVPGLREALALDARAS